MLSRIQSATASTETWICGALNVRLVFFSYCLVVKPWQRSESPCTGVFECASSSLPGPAQRSCWNSTWASRTGMRWERCRCRALLHTETWGAGTHPSLELELPLSFHSCQTYQREHSASHSLFILKCDLCMYSAPITQSRFQVQGLHKELHLK